MGGIRAKVHRRSKVEYVIIALNRDHDSNASDDGGLSPGAIGSTTPDLDAVAVAGLDEQLQEPSWLPWSNDILNGRVQVEINEGTACFPRQAAAAKVN